MIIDKALKKFYEVADSYDLLTAEREKELAAIIRKGGEQKQEAREELTNHNLKLVIKAAYKFYHKENSFPMGKDRSELTIMDLIGAGSTGLMKAVDLYNPSKYKTRFSTYAVSWIKQGMLSLLYSYNTPVHVPVHIVSNSRKYKKISETDKKGKLSDKDIMEIMDVTENGLKNIKKSKVSVFPMDRPLMGDRQQDEDTKTYRDFIPDTKQETPYESTSKKDQSETIRNALHILDPISRDVIEGQFLKSKKENLTTLGKRHKVSGERIRQIKDKALKKMKWELKRKTITHI